MSDREIDQLIASIKAHGEELAASTEKSRQLLIDLGVVDVNGNKTDRYKYLSIQ